MNDFSYWLLPRNCSQCGASVRRAARWCVRCGSALWPADDVPPAIRRARLDPAKLTADGSRPRLELATTPGLRPFAWGACAGDIWVASVASPDAQTAVYDHVRIEEGGLKISRMGEGPNLWRLVEWPIATRHGLFLVTPDTVVIFTGHGERAKFSKQADGTLAPMMVRRWWKPPKGTRIRAAAAMPDGRVMLAAGRDSSTLHFFCGAGQGAPAGYEGDTRSDPFEFAFMPAGDIAQATPPGDAGIDLLTGTNSDGERLVAFVASGELEVFNLETGRTTRRATACRYVRPLAFGSRHGSAPGVALSPRVTGEAGGHAAMVIGAGDNRAVFWVGPAAEGAAAGVQPLRNRAPDEPITLFIGMQGRTVAWYQEHGAMQGLFVGAAEPRWSEPRHKPNMCDVSLPAPIVLDDQVLRLDYLSPTGWRVQTLVPSRGLEEEASVFLDCDQSDQDQPCPRFMPPLAVHGYGLLIAVAIGERIRVLACHG